MAAKTRLDRAREWLLAHPGDTNAQAAAGSGVSAGSIQNARRQLVREGAITPSRKAKKAPSAPVQGIGASPEQKVPAPPAQMLDHKAMLALNDMAGSDLATLDDEEVQRRMLRQCIAFAFDTALHPDTRMSASQMWGKLRDQAKTKDLGPGVPTTFQMGVERLADLHRAVGVKMVLAAVNLAFPDVGGPDEGQLPPLASEAVSGALGTDPTP
jgi:hypothetical protein